MWVSFSLYRYAMNSATIIFYTVKDNNFSLPLNPICSHYLFHWCQHFSAMYFYLLFQHTNSPCFSVHHLLQWCELGDWWCDHTLGICCCWRGSKFCSSRVTQISGVAKERNQSPHSLSCGDFLIQSTTWVSQLSFCMCFVLPNSSEEWEHWTLCPDVPKLWGN